eukprot:5553486-Pyramimonas_sp.AAC.1
MDTLNFCVDPITVGPLELAVECSDLPRGCIGIPAELHDEASRWALPNHLPAGFAESTPVHDRIDAMLELVRSVVLRRGANDGAGVCRPVPLVE